MPGTNKKEDLFHRMNHLDRKVHLLERSTKYDDESDMPPQPPSVSVAYWLREQKVRPDYFAQVSWGTVSMNTCQADVDIWHVELRATDVAGNPIEPISGSDLFRNYAHVVTNKNQDNPHFVFGASSGGLAYPNKWYWQARVAIKDTAHRLGPFSAWTTPLLPGTQARPKPPDPIINSLVMVTAGSTKHHHKRFKLNYHEVKNWDVPGGDKETDLQRYSFQLWVQSGGTGAWALLGHQLRDALDDDTDTDEDVIFAARIRNRNKYRVRARSIDRWNRRGDWGNWYPSTAGVNPSHTINAPRNANVANPTAARIQVTWDPPQLLDANGQDIGPDMVEQYKIEMYKGVTLKETAYVGQSTLVYRYVVPNADRGASHNAKVYAVDEDGVLSSVGTSGSVSDVSPVALTDGLAPSPSPSLATGVTAAPGQLSLRWTATPNADPVQYEIHVSTLSGFAVGSTTLVGVVSGTMATIRTTGGASPTPLVVGTTYYVKLVVVDADVTGYGGSQTAAAAGTQGSGIPSAVSDGAAPPNSPSLAGAGAAIGMSQAIALRWVKTGNPDPVIYEVHVSTSSGFVPTPGGATMVGTTSDTTTIVRTDGGGARLIPGTDYYFRLISVDQDCTGYGGTQTPPAAGAVSPAVRMAGDGAAPTTSPTPIVTGMVSGLQIRWTTLPNNDPQTYQVHIGTTLGFTASQTAGVTKVAETTDNLITVRTLANGSPLSPGTLNAAGDFIPTDYYVRLLAVDSDCVGYGGTQALPAASNPAVKGNLAQVTGPDIAVNAIKADYINAGNLDSDFVVTGYIGSADKKSLGRRWFATADGIWLRDQNNNDLIVLPTDQTNTNPTFNGEVDATSLNVTQGALLQGASVLDRGGTLTLVSQLSDPRTSPNLSQDVETTDFNTAASDDLPRWGLWWDGTSYWYLCGTITGGIFLVNVNTSGVQVSRTAIDLSGFTGDATGLIKVFSMVKFSTRWYAMVQSAIYANYWMVWNDASGVPGTYVGNTVWDKNVNGPSDPYMTTDGTNLIVGWCTAGGASGTPHLTKYTVSGLVFTQASDPTSATVVPANVACRGVYVGNGDFGAASICIAWSTNRQLHINYYNASMLRSSAFEWWQAGTRTNWTAATGLVYDGANFRMLDSSGPALQKYSVWQRGTALNQQFFAAYSWYDNVGTLHESALSPRSSLFVNQRWRLSVTWPTIPVGLATVEDPNSVRVWLIQAGADPGSAFASYRIQATVVAANQTYLTAYSTATATQAALFPTVTNPAELRSTSGEPVLRGNGIPRCKVRYANGEGTTIPDNAVQIIRFGTEDVDTDGFHPNAVTTDAHTTVALADSTYDLTLPFAGQYLAILNMSWATSGTNRRQMNIYINAVLYDQLQSTPVGSVAHKFNGTFVVDAAAGDTLRVGALQNSTAVLQLQSAKLTLIYLGPI